jgi:16S rRNA processing protein RimM
MKQKYIEAGEIVTTHGIRGEVKVLPWLDCPEMLCEFERCRIDGKEVEIESCRVQKSCNLLKLAGVDTMEAAQAMRGKIIELYREDIDDEVIFAVELMGVEVYANGECIGKIIGVDVDQAPVIDKDYGTGITLTSATKGLAPTTYHTLVEVLVKDNWTAYAGKIEALGIVSKEPGENYVQLAESTLFEEGKFSREDYVNMVSALYDGTITVSGDLSAEPTPANVDMKWLGNIK